MSDDKEIKINCTGELDVNWRELKDLQTTESGKRIKSTDDEKINKLVASLIEFGLVNNLQIWIDPEDKTKYCFDAHHRRIAFEQLEKMGYELPLIPVTRCLADDRISAKQLLIIKESKSSWVMSETIEEYLVDIGMTLDVANEYIDLPDIDIDELLSENHNEYEGENIDAEPQIDHAEELGEKWKTQRGQIWQLGEHRLMCGDSTNENEMNKLMSGNNPDIIFFDPPYQIEEIYDNIPPPETFQKLVVFWDFKRFGIANHSAIEAGWNPLYELIWDCCQSWYTPNRPLARHKAAGIYGDDPTWNFQKSIIKDGKIREEKTVRNTRGECEYHPLDGAVHLQTVTQISNASMKDNHGHGKPIEWITAIMEGAGGNIVLDMFGGSGTVLIGCEKTKRKCFMMEIEKKYVAVILERYCNATNEEPKLIN